jgi:hypothetical protein
MWLVPSMETVRTRIPLYDSKDPRALGEALAELVKRTSSMSKLVQKDTMYVVTTFHTPKKTWIGERAFFARCAKHPELHAKMLAYVEQVTDRTRDLGHSDMRPIGCFAVVPLALRDEKYVAPLIAHMRGTDLDHETFHEALIDALVARHGLTDATLDLLAYRAVDGAGQNGESNLRRAYAHGLRDKLEGKGLDNFAARVDRISRRKPGQTTSGYRELYVANAGKALFAGEPEKFERWLAFFEKRGLKFDASDRELPERRDPGEANDFETEWLEDD